MKILISDPFYEAKEGVSYSICRQICDYLKENKL
tara:strand:- start:82 stop:183 length:102 start_codon:yes stop_codon:yes gene_type:complete